MKILSWIKKRFERLKLKNVAIVAVMITQALKRFVNSEFGQFVIEIIPVPWASLVGRIFGWAKKVNEILPEVVKGIVVTKGMLDEVSANNYQLSMSVLADHLKNYNKQDMNEFLAFMAMKIIEANSDGTIDDSEKREIMEEAYRFLFKTDHA